MQDDKIFIGTKEAADMLNMSINKVKKLCKTKLHGFPAVKDGGKYYISKEALYSWSEKVIADGLSLDLQQNENFCD